MLLLLIVVQVVKRVFCLDKNFWTGTAMLAQCWFRFFFKYLYVQPRHNLNDCKKNVNFVLPNFVLL